MPHLLPLAVSALALAAASAAAAGIPAPSSAQLSALAHTFTVFHHYSLCTYEACQWDLQTAAPTAFTPPDAGPDVDQWMAVSKRIGATQACLTVRHVDGFALWPSRTTNYSVAASAWRGGRGDVVADFVAAARRAGISPCLYVILGFNVMANHSGVSPARYLDDQVAVLTELLTNYGQIDRLWFDNYAIGRVIAARLAAARLAAARGRRATSHAPPYARRSQVLPARHG